MADKYDIPALMKLAVKKFKDRIQIWPQYDYAGIVSAVLESTHGKDIGLRPIISGICVKRMEDILGPEVLKEEAIEVKVVLFSAPFYLRVSIKRTRYTWRDMHDSFRLMNINSNLAITDRMAGKIFSLKTAISFTTFFGKLPTVGEMSAI